MIYVASSSGDIEVAEAAIAKIRRAGREVAHDWPAIKRSVKTPDREMHPADLAPYLREGLERSFGAHVMLVLASTKPTVGMWCEAAAFAGLEATFTSGFTIGSDGGIVAHFDGPESDPRVAFLLALGAELFPTVEAAIARAIDLDRERCEDGDGDDLALEAS